MNIYLCGERPVRLREELTDAHYTCILPLTLSLSSHRRLVVWGGNQGSDSQSGRASVYRSAGLRSRTWVPDVRFLPRAASGGLVNTHFKLIVFSVVVVVFTLVLFIFQLLYLPAPWGSCKSTPPSSDYFNAYSISACRTDCETRYLVENCNCRMVHMPGESLHR